MDNTLESILKAIEIIVDAKISNMQYDYTVRGKVISINNSDCVVEINGEQYTAKIKDGIYIGVGDIVLIQILKNNFSDKIVTGKIGLVGSGIVDSAHTHPNKALLDTYRQTEADLADAVNKKHTHNNYELLEKITQSDLTTYTHNQINASAEWIIQHNLNKYPSVTVVDSAGNMVIGDVIYNSENQITITFQSAFSGKAYLN